MRQLLPGRFVFVKTAGEFGLRIGQFTFGVNRRLTSFWGSQGNLSQKPVFFPVLPKSLCDVNTIKTFTMTSFSVFKLTRIWLYAALPVLTPCG
jgi:hypothetical protein